MIDCQSHKLKKKNNPLRRSTSKDKTKTTGVPYRMEQVLLFFFFGFVMAARIASSKTFLRPSCVKALHSRYFTAPISFAMPSAALAWTTEAPLAFKVDRVASSFLRSDFVPTSRIGTPGA